MFREREVFRSLLDIVMNQEKKKKTFFLFQLPPLDDRMETLIATMSPSAPFYSSNRTARLRHFPRIPQFNDVHRKVE